MVLEILFWILLILAAIGAFVPETISPYYGRGWRVVCMILFAILGLRVFGSVLR